MIDSIDEIDAIGHRVVHGGEKFKQSCLITAEVITGHPRSELLWLRCTTPLPFWASRPAYKVFGEDKPNVAVFDTAFHQHHAAQGLHVRHPL